MEEIEVLWPQLAKDEKEEVIRMIERILNYNKQAQEADRREMCVNG